MPRTPSSRQHAANTLGALSLVIADRINAAVEPIAAFGPSAPAAVTALHEFLDGGSITQLSSVLGLSHSGTVRLVDRLGAAGLVRRVAADDGRAVSLVLTSRGRRAAIRILGARQESLDAALAALSPSAVKELSATLDTMLTAVTLSRLEQRAAAPDGTSPPWLCRLCDFHACGRDTGKCPVRNAVATRGDEADTAE